MNLPDDVRKQLVALARQYSLPDDSSERLGALLRALDDEHAPTTVREPAAGIGVHIADSLTGLELDAVRSAAAIADLGAGAGFPGLPLALALPQARVALVESIARKCRFISAAAAAARIENVEVVPARAEEWAAGIGRNDVVTARALAPLGVLVEYAAPLLREDGVLVAWKGRRDSDEEADGARAAAVVGLELEQILPVAPYDGADHRHLHVLRKVAPTPERFPRRAGMARKRPL